MTLKNAIKTRNVKEIRKISNETPIADLADRLEEMEVAERVLFFRLLNTDVQSEIFSYLEPEFQEELIGSFTDKQIEEIIGDLYADEIADIVEEVPSEIARRILKHTPKETRASVNKILRYDDDVVGSVMDSWYP